MLMHTTQNGVTFRIYYHGTRNGKMKRAYHCPSCGIFYTEGDYTIESDEHVFGRPVRVVCCGKELPTPRMFMDAGHAKAFLETITSSPCGKREVLITKHSLLAALYNPSLIAALKQSSNH